MRTGIDFGGAKLAERGAPAAIGKAYRKNNAQMPPRKKSAFGSTSIDYRFISMTTDVISMVRRAAYRSQRHFLRPQSGLGALLGLGLSSSKNRASGAVRWMGIALGSKSSVPSNGVEVWLDKAEQHAAATKFDFGVLMKGRLAPDMRDFIYQVQSACDYIKGAGRSKSFVARS
jgi:hypothetical protein